MWREAALWIFGDIPFPHQGWEISWRWEISANEPPNVLCYAKSEKQSSVFCVMRGEERGLIREMVWFGFSGFKLDVDVDIGSDLVRDSIAWVWERRE